MEESIKIKPLNRLYVWFIVNVYTILFWAPVSLVSVLYKTIRTFVLSTRNAISTQPILADVEPLKIKDLFFKSQQQ